MPFQGPEAVGRRYALPVHPMPGGDANRCYALGDSLVLRVPRDASAAADLAREAVVIPYAIAAGVPTSSIVEYTGDHMIVTRVPGADAVDVPVSAEFYELVGEGLAALHTVTSVPGLPADAPDDPLALVNTYAGDGLIDPATAHWLTAWFEKLRRPPLPVVLVHGDVAPQNLMVDAGGRFTGFVDWGDARLADPATDFAKLPLPSVDQALRGYLGSADLGDWPARVLGHHLHWALGRLASPTPVPAGRHWTASPYARLFGIMRFFTAPPEPWAGLLP
ncbi:aminoglycoside phosphotransferase family protein [Actinoplanes sp. NPDC051470]|uniref:phosphotransferase family protein n=1 Tax=Actinoplanes sp. NPDC051470 TaxID=3157224 RepID=UPI003423FAD3